MAFTYYLLAAVVDKEFTFTLAAPSPAQHFWQGLPGSYLTGGPASDLDNYDLFPGVTVHPPLRFDPTTNNWENLLGGSVTWSGVPYNPYPQDHQGVIGPSQTLGSWEEMVDAFPYDATASGHEGCQDVAAVINVCLYPSGATPPVPDSTITRPPDHPSSTGCPTAAAMTPTSERPSDCSCPAGTVPVLTPDLLFSADEKTCTKVKIDADGAKALATSLEQTLSQLKRTGATDKQLAKAKVLLDQLKDIGTDLATNTSSGDLAQSKRQEVFVNAAVGLIGTFIPDGGDQLPALATKIETLAKQAQGKLSTDQQLTQFANQVTDLVSTFATKNLKGEAQKELKNNIGELGKQIGNLARVLSGTASADDMDDILSDAVVGLLERTAFSGELSPALFDGTMLAGAKCTVFLSAFQLGYGLGSPFGAAVSKGLGAALNATAKKDVLSALMTKDADWLNDATREPVTVSGHTRALGDYSITAFSYTDQAGNTQVFVQGVVNTSLLAVAKQKLGLGSADT
ncbi:MAG TPA: hypothetical protein VEJ84_07810, partial [Acidimicrobiales bacterium]|nr:hypothetical protein [Acidimicrobiales bacterium]